LKVKCKGKEFDVYETNEADSLKIKTIENWRKAKVGDWILTHDNKIVQCIGRRSYNIAGKIKPLTFIRTGFGETPTYYGKIYAKQQKNWTGDELVHKQYVRNIPPTALQKRFADYLSKHGTIDKNGQFDSQSIVDAYTSSFSENNPQQALRRGIRILRKKHITDRISMNMREKFMEIGIDDEWVANQYKDLIIDAPPNAKLNALNRVSDLLGHTKKEKEEKTQNIIMISEGDKKLLAEARKELSDKDIGKLINIVKEKGIDGVLETENTESNYID